MAQNDSAAAPALEDVLVVRLGEHRLALRLQDVGEVLPAVATVPLPAADELVAGVMNLHGRALPVLDVRRRLGVPARPVRPEDHFVTCQVARRPVALWVDAAEAVTRASTQTLAGGDRVRAGDHPDGVAVADDGLVLVYNLDAFLDGDELLRLDRATAASGEVR